ncbi:MAG: hypothetical protein FWH04_06750 [Oscillospiraceae bacterium]|nr:hypothetical protein [Oscillospiraceae bacterium]
MNHRTVLELPKDKKEIRLTVKLNQADLAALRLGMDRVGETNQSSFIRRLIHENKRR